MKILVVHSRYRSAAPSGENRVVDQEGAALRRAGHEVELFERDSDDIDGWSPARRALLPATVVHDPGARRAIAADLRRFQPDVVHVHNTFPLVSASALVACHDAGTPVVATIHNYKLLSASGDLFRNGAVCHDCVGRIVATPALEHRCYRASLVATAPVVASMTLNRGRWRRLVSAYIFVSDAQRRLCAALDLPGGRVFVKPNLVPPPPGESVPREPVVAYLGRLDHAKGIPLLMEAWSRRRAGADGGLRLAVAGDGPLKGELQAWAAGRADVDVLGTLDRVERGALLRRARAVVLPSQWEETFGLVAIEAMSVGTPPVAAAHGSFPELIDDGVNGVLAPPGDPDALAEALSAVGRDPDRFAALGEAAARTYRERHDPDANVRALIDIYAFATGRRPSAVERATASAGG